MSYFEILISLRNKVSSSINLKENYMSATFALMSAPTTSVVQNDINKAAKVIPSTTTAPKLSEMEAKRQQWETTAYRTSNQQLYAVLADCLAYGEALPLADAKQRTKDLEEFFKLRGYSVKSDSPLLARVVKAVFGNVDRRRISTYSLVLRTAQKEGITAGKLAGWIEERGGVQEVKLSRSATYVSPKAKAEQAKSTLSALPNLAVAKEKLAELADADFVGSECVLLAEQHADGSFHIKALTRSGTAVKAALTALYSEQQKAAA
jgi:hypothetical protein